MGFSYNFKVLPPDAVLPITISLCTPLKGRERVARRSLRVRLDTEIILADQSI